MCKKMIHKGPVFFKSGYPVGVFSKGCEIFSEKFKGLKITRKILRGLKITWKILRGAKFPVPEKIRCEFF